MPPNLLLGGGYGRIDTARAGPSEGQEAHGRDREDNRARGQDPRTAFQQARFGADRAREDRGADLLPRSEGAGDLEAGGGAGHGVVRGAPLRRRGEGGDR